MQLVGQPPAEKNWVHLGHTELLVLSPARYMPRAQALHRMASRNNSPTAAKTETQLGSSTLSGSAGIQNAAIDVPVTLDRAAVARHRRQDAPIDRALIPRPVRRFHVATVVADSMDEPAATMASVGALEDLMPSSSVMEDSRALGIDAIGGGHLEEEQRLSQVSYLIRSLCLFFYVV